MLCSLDANPNGYFFLDSGAPILYKTKKILYVSFVSREGGNATDQSG